MNVKTLQSILSVMEKDGFNKYQPMFNGVAILTPYDWIKRIVETQGTDRHFDLTNLENKKFVMVGLMGYARKAYENDYFSTYIMLKSVVIDLIMHYEVLTAPPTFTRSI